MPGKLGFKNCSDNCGLIHIKKESSSSNTVKSYIAGIIEAYSFGSNIIILILEPLKKIIPAYLTLLIVLSFYHMNVKQFYDNVMYEINARFHYLVSFFYLQCLFLIIRLIFSNGPTFAFHFNKLSLASFGKDISYFMNIAIISPICEEFIFRGLILSQLDFRINKRYFNTILCCLFFALYHLLNLFNVSIPYTDTIYQCVFSFIVGCVYCLHFYKNKSLYIVIIFHIYNNFAYSIYPVKALSSTMQTLCSIYYYIS
ncbi:hypothetical protein WA158_008084 [Blastocystis sp. Blastoise]